jgi:asparagine synthase (glutamine-hydrolysing)
MSKSISSHRSMTPQIQLLPPAPAGSRYGLEHEFGFVPSFSFRGRAIGPGELMEVVRSTTDVSLDLPALNVFLRAGIFLNGATPFREVRRFCPPAIIVGPTDLNREQAIDAYASLFSQAIKRRADPSSVLALSGGRDSRHILLELHAQNVLPKYALTVDIDTTNDREIAEQLARTLGVHHRVLPPCRSMEGAARTVRGTDFMSIQHAWFADVARERDGSSWWDGIGGDVLSSGLFVEEWNMRLFETGHLDELAERMVSRASMGYFGDQSHLSRDDAVEAIHGELARHVNAANPVGSYHFWNRTRTDIGSSAFGMLRLNGQTTLAPFLDRDLWSLLASFPARMTIHGKFRDEVIARTYPRFSGIPYAEKRSVARSQHRRRAARMLRHLAVHRVTAENLRATMRTLRSLVVPSKASEIEWILGSWMYVNSLYEASSGI